MKVFLLLFVILFPLTLMAKTSSLYNTVVKSCAFFKQDDFQLRSKPDPYFVDGYRFHALELTNKTRADLYIEHELNSENKGYINIRFEFNSVSSKAKAFIDMAILHLKTNGETTLDKSRWVDGKTYSVTSDQAYVQCRGDQILVFEKYDKTKNNNKAQLTIERLSKNIVDVNFRPFKALNFEHTYSDFHLSLNKSR